MIGERITGGMTRRSLYVGALLGLAASGILSLAGGARAQDGYQKPSNAILKVLNAPATPRASVGRARDIDLLYSPILYPSIADVANLLQDSRACEWT